MRRLPCATRGQAQCSEVICHAYTEDACIGPCSVIYRFHIFTPQMGLLTDRALSLQATKYLKVSPSRSPVRGKPQTDAASMSTGSQSPSVQVHLQSFLKFSLSTSPHPCQGGRLLRVVHVLLSAASHLRRCSIMRPGIAAKLECICGQRHPNPKACCAGGEPGRLHWPGPHLNSHDSPSSAERAGCLQAAGGSVTLLVLCRESAVGDSSATHPEPHIHGTANNHDDAHQAGCVILHSCYPNSSHPYQMLLTCCSPHCVAQ